MSNQQRDFKWIWIPKEIWLSEDLTLQEKVFLVEIDSLDNEEWCYANNEYFSKFFGISKVRVSEVISSLIKKGYIESNINAEEGNKRTLKTLLKKSLWGSQTKVYEGHKEKFKHSNTKNNTSSNTDISTIVDKEQALEAPQEYGKKEINEALSFLSNTIGIDEFKEPVAKQRQYANHIVKLAEKIGKAEFIERLKGILSDWFKKKNCNSIAYLYRELKSFIHEEKSLVPTEKKVINSIWVL